MPTTEVLIATLAQQVVCSISLVGDGNLGASHGLAVSRRSCSRGASWARLWEKSPAWLNPEDAGTFPLLVKLIAALAQIGVKRGIGEVLIAVHPRHARFYTRFFGFQAMGGVKAYGGVCDNPAIPMFFNVESASRNHPRAYKTLFGKPIDEALLRPRSLSVTLRDEIEFLAAETTGHYLSRSAVIY